MSRKAADDVQDVAKPQDWIRVAAERRWASPGDTWEETAEKVGRSRQQLQRVRATPEWERAFQEAGKEYIEKLAPKAYAALLAAWEKGNPTGALEILRSFGLVPKEAIDLNVGAIEQIHRFEPSTEFLARVAANLRDLKLPEPERVLAIDMAPALEETKGDDPAEASDVDEYIAETQEVRPHRNGATPPPSGIGIVRRPGSNPDRWNWDR